MKIFGLLVVLCQVMTTQAGACFSSETTVYTPDGPKRMDQLKTGEQVLVSTKNGHAVYQPVESWYHRVAEQQAQFVTIETATTKRVLSLTPNHLLPLAPCAQVKAMTSDQLGGLVYSQSKFASSATVGQCVVVLRRGVFVAEPIAKVMREVKTGIFSPITSQGTLVVDGIHASCFSTLQNHDAQLTLHRRVLDFYNWMERVVGVKLNSFSESEDIPIPVKIAMTIAKVALPHSMFGGN